MFLFCFNFIFKDFCFFFMAFGLLCNQRSVYKREQLIDISKSQVPLPSRERKWRRRINTLCSLRQQTKLEIQHRCHFQQGTEQTVLLREANLQCYTRRVRCGESNLFCYLLGLQHQSQGLTWLKKLAQFWGVICTNMLHKKQLSPLS